MATIKEKKKNGKTVSYSFTVCLGRDANGKQVRRYTTWMPPEGLTLSKAKKAAERAAVAWEVEVKAETEAANEQSNTLPPEPRRDDFVSFVNDTWFSLFICNGDRKETTTAFYEDIAKYITAYFKGAILQEITAIQIQHYLRHLRIEHETRTGKPLSARYLHHQYGTLKNIFGYAERNDLISKNPMKHVASPKIPKKPVDALTSEQAAIFFKELYDCPLDFRALLHLMITTGLVCDDEAKLNGKELNRALRDEDGQVYDVVAGTFLIVGLGEEDCISLTDEQIRYFQEKFAVPEIFLRVGDKLLVLQGGDPE